MVDPESKGFHEYSESLGTLSRSFHGRIKDALDICRERPLTAEETGWPSWHNSGPEIQQLPKFLKFHHSHLELPGWWNSLKSLNCLLQWAELKPSTPACLQGAMNKDHGPDLLWPHQHYRPEHSSPPSLPPASEWVTSPLRWQRKCQVEAKCWNKNGHIPTPRRDETLGRGLYGLGTCMREQGRWVLGWGHSTARLPLELEHVKGGRETKDGMKTRVQED